MAWSHPVPKITDDERRARLSRLQAKLAEKGLAGLLLGSTESLRYFTGLVWRQSERLVGALVTPDSVTYIVPGFEESRVESLPHLPGKIAVWQEDESSAALVASLMSSKGGKLALDDALPLFVYHQFAEVFGPDRLVDGGRMIRDLRLRKTAAEIALIEHAMGLTLEVHRRAHGIIKPGVKASEVVRYIDEQHRALGVSGYSFCIVSFGVATSLPHGADGDQTYRPGDVVLVDTGCRLDGYHSDLTRTYVMEEPTKEFATAWAIEREAEQAVFDAAKLGATCGSLDDAARKVLAKHGLGPDYALPGLPHRAGHGLGMEIHEEPYIVRGNPTVLEPGMCFSNEPMIVYPGRFGIRLEDHIHMTDAGPKWFTQPSKGPAEPFV